MAASQSTPSSLSRRSFIASLGAASAAVVAPVSADASTAPATWASPRRQVEALRVGYLAEVERLAEELRPRFEAGEVGGMTDRDSDRMLALERACAEAFGLIDDPAALLVLAASPSADAVMFNGLEIVPLDCAREAAAWDVIDAAKGRGWYKPAPGEYDGPSA